MSRSLDRASSQYLHVDTAPSLSDWPISVFFLAYLTDSSGAWNCAFCTGDKDDPYTVNHIYLTIDGTTPRIRWSDAVGDTLLISSYTLAVDTWYTFGFIITSSNAYLYLNTQEDSVANTRSYPADVDHLNWSRLYSSNFTGDYWIGHLAQCGIWNAALNSEERAALNQRISPQLVRPSALVHYWPFIENGDDNDRFGGLNLTPVNSPTWTAHPRVFMPAGIHVGLGTAAPTDAMLLRMQEEGLYVGMQA